uniref:Uncharacterized protein n=1 Tax=Avena sativa TaxID=4498 RepID=A0ACD5Z868_AVESA
MQQHLGLFNNGPPPFSGPPGMPPPRAFQQGMGAPPPFMALFGQLPLQLPFRAGAPFQASGQQETYQYGVKGTVDTAVPMAAAPEGVPIAPVALIARRCPVRDQWRWEALPHGEAAFLASFPSFEDLNRVYGIQVSVPPGNSQLAFSVFRAMEVPHKFELKQVWLHVEGVPHCLRSFWGLWAVGGLMGLTQDVDLFSLRRRGVVRILVTMNDTSVFSQLSDALGHYLKTYVVVQLKAYELRFSLEPAGYAPEPEFVPFLWRKRDEDHDDDTNGKGPNDAMDMSDSTGGLQDIGVGSSSAQTGQGDSVPPFSTHRAQLSSQGSAPLIAVTPFNPNPSTLRGKEILESLPLGSPLRGVASTVTSPRVSPSQLQAALRVAAAGARTSQRSSSPACCRPNVLGRSVPRREGPVLEPVLQGLDHESMARRLAQVGPVDRGAPPLSPISPWVMQTGSSLIQACGLGWSGEPGSPSRRLAQEGLVVRDFSSSSPLVVLDTPVGPLLSREPGPPSTHAVLAHGDASGGATGIGRGLAAQEGQPGHAARRSARHGIDASGASATDEDLMVKAMRRKAEKNLDSQGDLSCHGYPTIMDYSPTALRGPKRLEGSRLRLFRGPKSARRNAVRLALAGAVESFRFFTGSRPPAAAFTRRTCSPASRGRTAASSSRHLALSPQPPPPP